MLNFICIFQFSLMPNPLHSHLSASFTPNVSLKWPVWDTETIAAVTKNDWVKVKIAFSFHYCEQSANTTSFKKVAIEQFVHLHILMHMCMHIGWHKFQKALFSLKTTGIWTRRKKLRLQSSDTWLTQMEYTFLPVCLKDYWFVNLKAH